MTDEARLVLNNVEVNQRPCRVLIEAGHITAISDIASRPGPDRGALEIDGNGGALLPGLWDHHVHLPALAASARSVFVGPPQVRDAEGLRGALAAATADQFGWIRAVGYHESVAGSLNRSALDEFAPDVALRVQHRSGGLWIFNSKALELLASVGGAADEAGPDHDGRLLRDDPWLATRLALLRRHDHHASPSPAPPDRSPAASATEIGDGLIQLSGRLAASGVTGCTEASPALTLEAAQLLERSMAQRLLIMSNAAWTHQRPLGSPVSSTGGARLGPAKIMVTEDALPPLDGREGLATMIASCHVRGRPVAIHVVSRAALALVVAAFDDVGSRPGDRVEHAAVSPPELAGRLADLGITVVTQPNFIAERGDQYLAEVDLDDQPWLYRLAGHTEAGVPLGGGTDAPFGDPDPWAAMAAAVSRRTSGGSVVGPSEALSPEAALALFTTNPRDPGGRSRQVGVGLVADLCLLDRPWSEARRALVDVVVEATLIDGRMT